MFQSRQHLNLNISRLWNMGICLDTEQSDGSQAAFEEGQETWTQNSPKNVNKSAPAAGIMELHNDIPVQFESPKVPVIFVLGGPGSGKVTHCDNLMQEKQGIIHINMTDLLQQYAIGNDGLTSLINIGNSHQDMQDFGLLSSKTVTEVLMLEIKMSPNAKTYLVSGYPRNMRDVVEYSEKIQMVSGVILISWRKRILERQIDYGAKLGQVVLSLARMELNNFYKNVMPVADYFDQSSMLITINGERHPQDVYMDFRTSIFRILGQQDNPPIFSNGKSATVPSDVTTELPTVSTTNVVTTTTTTTERITIEDNRPKTQVISVNEHHRHPGTPYPSGFKNNWPPVLWVIGGPGSNKAALCSQACRETDWTHISLGKLLRAAAEPPDPRINGETAKIRECITAGELVPLEIVMKFVESHMAANMNVSGIILDGFPRDMAQVAEFEAKFKQKPTIILLDCSKLQLGRGRLDDSVTAFRRRLEIFRQSSLPMLKSMDNIGRLTIVDGDTDTTVVQDDFKSVVKEHIHYIRDNQLEQNVPNGNIGNGRVPNVHITDTSIQDLETHPERSNAKMGNGVILKNGHLPNGFSLPKYNNEDKQLYTEVNYMDGHI